MRTVLALLLISLHGALAAESSKECPQGKHSVSSYTQGDYYKADGTFVRAHTVNAHCRTNPRGYEKWHSKLKTGRPRVWGYKKEQSVDWTESNVERTLEAISELPDLLFEQEPAGIYRMRKSRTPANPATTNTGLSETVLYDLAFQTSSNLAQVLAHEFSHLLYKKLPEEERKSYLTISKWLEEKIGNSTMWINRRPPNQFMTDHAKESPDEDFATNIEYFLFKPAKLKNVAPQIHSWIEKQLGDKLKKRLPK